MASQQIDNNDESGGDIPSPISIKPTKSEAHATQFSSWYHSFRNLDKTTIKTNTTTKRIRKNVTIESIIIRPLPTDFVEYLSSDGVCLPECAKKVSSCMNDDVSDDDRYNSSSNDDEDDSDEDGSNTGIKKHNFPELTSQIQTALSTLSGPNNLGIMPKLNWSSPKDATWMNCGSLKCTKVGDIYLLLKSSDFIVSDLEFSMDDCLDDDDTASVKQDGVEEVNDMIEGISITKESNDHSDEGAATANIKATTEKVISTNANASCSDTNSNEFEYELVLRKWCNLHPSMEFRCFVYAHELVAISQRQASKFYPHLQPPLDNSIHPSQIMINAFFETYIQRRFANGSIHKYVVDVYLDSQERVWIVDFNVWSDRTDALLFDWKCLTELPTRITQTRSNENNNNSTQQVDDNDKEENVQDSIPVAEMRVVTKDMKSMTYDPLSSYRGPTDVMDLLGSDGNYAASFEDFRNQCVRPSEM